MLRALFSHRSQSTTSKQCLFSQAAMPEDTGMVSLAEIPVGLFSHSSYTHLGTSNVQIYKKQHTPTSLLWQHSDYLEG